jgi:hypothetical protein
MVNLFHEELISKVINGNQDLRAEALQTPDSDPSIFFENVEMDYQRHMYMGNQGAYKK